MLAAHARLACSSGHASTRSELPCGAAGPSTPSDALPSAIASQLLTRHDLTPTLPPPTSHATMQARAASSHAELPGPPRLQMLARLSPSVLPLPLLTCHGSHPCCNSATDSRGRRPTPWCRRGTYHHPLPSLGHRHTAHPSCRTSTAQGTRGITSPTALRSMLIDHTSLFDHRGGGCA